MLFFFFKDLDLYLKEQGSRLLELIYVRIYGFGEISAKKSCNTNSNSSLRLVIVK